MYASIIWPNILNSRLAIFARTFLLEAQSLTSVASVLRSPKITEFGTECEILQYYARAYTPTPTGVWFENSEFVRESWRCNFMKFRSQGGPGGRARTSAKFHAGGENDKFQVDSEKQLIRSRITVRIPDARYSCSQLCARECVRTYEISHVNCAHRAYTGDT